MPCQFTLVETIQTKGWEIIVPLQNQSKVTNSGEIFFSYLSLGDSFGFWPISFYWALMKMEQQLEDRNSKK